VKSRVMSSLLARWLECSFRPSRKIQGFGHRDKGRPGEQAVDRDVGVCVPALAPGRVLPRRTAAARRARLVRGPVPREGSGFAAGVQARPDPLSTAAYVGGGSRRLVTPPKTATSISTTIAAATRPGTPGRCSTSWAGAAELTGERPPRGRNPAVGAEMVSPTYRFPPPAATWA
jgi:hypothetical protein